MINYKDIKIEENFKMAQITAMRVGGIARFFCEVFSIDELKNAIEFAYLNKIKFFIFSGGTNLLLSDNYLEIFFIKPNIKGIQKVFENNDIIKLKINAGEIWDDVVLKIVGMNLWGIENLSGIPGLCGAFAVQNVGAYGQEASNVIEVVEVFDIKDNLIKTLTKNDCEFSYRKSIFNSTQKGRYVITAIVLILQKKAKAFIQYPDLILYFKNKNIIEPTLKMMREAVLEIRKNKLPLPNEIGNCGSFFKNLFLEKYEYEILKNNVLKNFGNDEYNKLEEIKNKFLNNDKIKIPTALLIDMCGLKGFCIGGACVHKKQPLVLINKTGNASANDIMNLFLHIQKIVLQKCGVKITNEPEFVGW